MIIEEIMTTSVIAADEEMPITQIAEIVSKNRIHGVPVINREKRVVGIITETDFFRKDSAGMVYIPQLIDFLKSGVNRNADEEDQSVKAVIQAVAKDIMTKDCVNVRPGTSIEEFITLVRDNGFNTFPVVNESGVLVGVVTVYDMIKMI